MSVSWSDRGAAAVEFALVALILMPLLLGIMEFGRAYNAQISLTGAARDGARTMAIEEVQATAQATARVAAKKASPSLNPQLTDSQITFLPASCTPGTVMKVTIKYPMNYMTGFFGKGLTLTGKGAMRCGG